MFWLKQVFYINAAGGEANWMWMVGDGVDGEEKLLNATPAVLYTLVCFTQIPEWWVPAKVIDLLDFSIRKITSVAVFLITFFLYNFLIFATRHHPPNSPWKITARWWQDGEKDCVWASVCCQTSSGETVFE